MTCSPKRRCTRRRRSSKNHAISYRRTARPIADSWQLLAVRHTDAELHQPDTRLIEHLTAVELHFGSGRSHQNIEVRYRRETAGDVQLIADPELRPKGG